MVDLSSMKDPSILQYSRLIYENEASELGEINLNDEKFNIGFYFVNAYDNSQTVQLPESIGHFVTGVRNKVN